MCGINGIWMLNPNQVLLSEKITEMNACLKHRGPDAQASFVNEHLALGHTRLAIIDLQASSNQPMYSSDGRYVLVFNGEIYNYRELRERLKPEYNFKTQSDTEVVLALFQKYDLSCLTMLDGMFAFAIYDIHQKRLVLARDRFGVKPLYYYSSPQNFVFSSEMQAIIKSKVSQWNVNRNAISSFLNRQTVLAPETMLQEIKMLEAGKYLILEKGNYKTGLFYSLKEQYQSQIQSVATNRTQVLKTISDLFYKAVEKRLVADVTFGAFLSGGIDSTAVVGAMSKCHTQKINTYSVIFDEQEFSEAKYARLASQTFGTHHHEIKVNPKELLNIIPEAFKAMNFPSVDGINTYLVSKVTRETGVKMVLSGIGGDELFAGYPSFKRLYALHQKQTWFKIPYALRKGLANMMPKNQSIQINKILEIMSLKHYDLPHAHLILRQLFSQEQIQYLSPGAPKIAIDGLRVDSKHILSAVSYLEHMNYLSPVLLRDTDQMSMAHALEVREPFLDHALVEYALSIPDDLKYPHTPKQIFVDALPELLPNEIVNRPKMGFVLPWEMWLRNELHDWVQQNITRLSKRSYFNEVEVLNLWKKFKAEHKSVSWSRIWALVVLEQWFSKHEIQ